MFVLITIALSETAWWQVEIPERAMAAVTLPAIVVQPAMPEPGRDANAIAQILARPLFSPKRRPAVAQPEPEQLIDALRLTGIIVSPGGRLAIFQLATAARPIVLGEGASVGRWKTQTIASDRVTLTDGAKVVTLRTTFAQGPPASTPVPLEALRTRDGAGRHPSPPTYLQRRG